MQIRYEITPADYLEMLKARRRIAARLPLLLLDGVGLVLGIVATYLLGPMWILVAAVFLVGMVTQLFMPHLIYWRVYSRNRRLFESRIVTFTDEGIESEKESGRTEVRWSSFERFKETKNLFLTFQTKDVAGIVPKRAFPNPEAIAEFRKLLASKLPGN
ncbi:MAG TPA: YcxB family protein [Candidatus Acidoferrum sp.]|nr:YcxB family protein [Candidatus Acidoferrum sp.]